MRDTLSKVDGVTDVKVDFDRKTASFKVDTEKTTPEAVVDQLAEKSEGRYTATVQRD